jgi:hypothetical protein
MECIWLRSFTATLGLPHRLYTWLLDSHAIANASR